MNGDSASSCVYLVGKPREAVAALAFWWCHQELLPDAAVPWPCSPCVLLSNNTSGCIQQESQHRVGRLKLTGQAATDSRVSEFL